MEECAKEYTCDFSNMYKAMMKCKKGVTWKDSVSRYTNNGLTSILKLCNQLDTATYTIDDYYKFIIYEPKKREIVSTKFKDRVLQRSLCDEYLYEQITKSFIYDNSACQLNRGTDFSRNRLKTHLHKYYRKHGSIGYVLKCDFKNYFGSTPHSTAKEALIKVINDKWALEHAFKIIDSYDKGSQIGLGLGSQITQLIQLLVLNDLDHHIKERLKIKQYVRYMDDMLLIHSDKKYLQQCLVEIEKFIIPLGLTLNGKKTQIFKIEQGISFLGFTFNLTKTGKVIYTVSKENIKKRKRKLKKHRDLVLKGDMSKAKADECYLSWRAHASKGNSYNTLKFMDKYYEKLWEH